MTQFCKGFMLRAPEVRAHAGKAAWLGAERLVKRSTDHGWAALLCSLLAILGVVPLCAQAEKTQRDGNLPLVYALENTGARYPTPTFPSFGQLPIIRPLPDPYLFTNGLRDKSFPAWEARRNEIKAAIEKYEIGPKPDCSDCSITANYVPAAPGVTNARGTLTVVVTRRGKSLTLTSGVYLPQIIGGGLYPALIPMTFVAGTSGPNYGSLPAGAFANTPVATIDFVHNQVAAYTFALSSHANDPFYQLYPELCAGVCNGTSNSGEYAAWSWGVSRLIDGILIASRQPNNPLPIDVSHLAVTGCSYAGKMALYAGAFDERIALTISQENGGGGAASWRVSHEIEANGAVEKIDNTSKEWFGGQMQQFAGNNVYKLPVDHDELMDMVAPRALLETGNTDFYWLSNRSNYVSARATQKVFNGFGIGDRFGFYLDGGHPHCGTLPAELPAVQSFVNRFLLGQTTVETDVQVQPFGTLDAKRWTAWWGKGGADSNPQFPTDWVSNGSAVIGLRTGVSPLPLNAGQSLAAGYQLRVPGDHPAATATVNNGNVQADFRCSDGETYTLSVPFAAAQKYNLPANRNAWVPGAGQYQGVGLAQTCADGASQAVLQDAYLSALGAANGVGNPPSAPGFVTTAPDDPLQVRFSCSTGVESTAYSPVVNVNKAPQP